MVLFDFFLKSKEIYLLTSTFTKNDESKSFRIINICKIISIPLHNVRYATFERIYLATLPRPAELSFWKQRVATFCETQQMLRDFLKKAIIKFLHRKITYEAYVQC